MLRDLSVGVRNNHRYMYMDLPDHFSASEIDCFAECLCIAYGFISVIFFIFLYLVNSCAIIMLNK